MASRIAQIRLVSSHPEVYEPCDDSFALVDALLADRTNLLQHQPALCLELGCGSGYVITSLALIVGQEAQYIATDINPHAVKVTHETLEAHGVHAELINTNIASGLEERLKGLVDVIVVNPPYVPTPEDEVGREGIASAWAGGENGRTVIDKMLPVADTLLSKKGWLYMVTLTEKQSLADMPSNERKGLCFQNPCPEIDRGRKSTNHKVLVGFRFSSSRKGKQNSSCKGHGVFALSIPYIPVSERQ